ncbi:hypothetical protein FOZ60_004398 [Perkinsus olseni]|uniref:Uncharacterized protein n=1 Tax=Perkinsus olseni TaxID=32597 RepID=A0A7J6PNP6_PEROL|nr:hypothetical protein FOZ60_004398 [Perkinsus olseni]
MISFARSLLWISALSSTLALQSNKRKRARTSEAHQEVGNNVENRLDRLLENQISWLINEISSLKSQRWEQNYKMSKRADEISELKDGVSKQTDLISDIIDFTRQIESTSHVCKIRYSDSTWSMEDRSLDDDGGYSIYWGGLELDSKAISYWVNGDSVSLEFIGNGKIGVIEGDADQIGRIFSEVLPFTHLLNRVAEGFQNGMTDYECLLLRTYIHWHPP